MSFLFWTREYSFRERMKWRLNWRWWVCRYTPLRRVAEWWINR